MLFVEGIDKLLQNTRIPKAILKIKNLHFLISLIRSPVLSCYAIDRGHLAGAMSPSFAVDINWPVLRIVDELEVKRDLLTSGGLLRRERNMEILKSCTF